MNCAVAARDALQDTKVAIAGWWREREAGR